MKKIEFTYNYLFKALVSLIFILGISSYEINIHNSLYSIVNLVILLVGFLLVLISVSKRKGCLNVYISTIKSNPLVTILSFMLMLSTLFSSMKVSYLGFSSLYSVVAIIISIYIFFVFIPVLISKDINEILNWVKKFLTIISLFGIVIGLRGGWWIYSLDGSRSASIMFDSNYFATLAGIACLLYIKDRRFSSYMMAMINLLGVFYSGSRAAMVSIFLVLIISNFYYNKISLKKISIVIFIASVTYMGMVFLHSISYFRVAQGMTGRDNLWLIGINRVLQEPLWGYGYGQVQRILQQENIYAAASVHNYFIDFALMFGLPALLMNLSIIVIAFIRGLKYNAPSFVMEIILFLLINMNSIVISIGGVGALSLIFTVFLGIANNYDNTPRIQVVPKILWKLPQITR